MKKKREFFCIGGGFEKSQFEKEILSERHLLLLALLGQEHCLDVRQDTSLGDGHS